MNEAEMLHETLKPHKSYQEISPSSVPMMTYQGHLVHCPWKIERRHKVEVIGAETLNGNPWNRRT
jgi:hypothetical protein